jgi:hypothetical protein
VSDAEIGIDNLLVRLDRVGNAIVDALAEKDLGSRVE